MQENGFKKKRKKIEGAMPLKTTSSVNPITKASSK